MTTRMKPLSQRIDEKHRNIGTDRASLERKAENPAITHQKITMVHAVFLQIEYNSR